MILRMKKQLIALALAFAPMMTHAQSGDNGNDDIHHAPTIEQCRLDFAFWKGDMEGATKLTATETDQANFYAKLNRHSYGELVKRVLEMSPCAVVATETREKFDYDSLSSVYQFGAERRIWSFLKRDGLWNGKEQVSGSEWPAIPTRTYGDVLTERGLWRRFVAEDERGDR